MQKRIFLSLISIFLFLSTNNLHATMMYSGGTYVPFFNKAQINNSGDSQKFDLTPYAGIGKQFHLAGPQYFMPELGLAYWLENAKKTQKSMVFLHYNFSYVLSPLLIWRYGLSTHWYRIKGEGGTVSLRNGNGTSTFNAPSKTVTSYFTTFNLGAEFFLSRERSIRFDLQMMNVNKFEDKAYNYLLTLNLYR